MVRSSQIVEALVKKAMDGSAVAKSRWFNAVMEEYFMSAVFDKKKNAYVLSVLQSLKKETKAGYYSKRQCGILLMMVDAILSV